MGRILGDRHIEAREVEGLLKVVTDYSLALKLLDDYDHSRLSIGDTTEPPRFFITYGEAWKAIAGLAKQSGIAEGSLFGLEKDQSFKGSLAAIYQTFEGNELYPSIEEKAAHLLYFVVKNHSFVDGNSRWRAYEYEELIGRDKASLDIFWLKDESLEDSDNLPDPGVIAQEIVDDLEAALEQLRAIAEDLGPKD